MPIKCENRLPCETTCNLIHSDRQNITSTETSNTRRAVCERRWRSCATGGGASRSTWHS